MVSVMMSSSMPDSMRRLIAGPESTPWVQHEATFLAPFSRKRHPPVGQCPGRVHDVIHDEAYLAFTSPMMCMTLDSLARSRLLSMMARSP
jgi:hypothetical protein